VQAMCSGGSGSLLSYFSYIQWHVVIVSLLQQYCDLCEACIFCLEAVSVQTASRLDTQFNI